MIVNHSNVNYNDIKNKLQRDKKFRIKITSENSEKIFQEDDNLKELFGIDSRTNSVVYLKDPPWKINSRNIENIFDMKNDLSKLNIYLSLCYKFNNKQLLQDFIIMYASQLYVHPIEKYLKELKWDGVNRLETLFIDYLHAEDNEFNRSITRKTLIGAVAKIYSPGHNHDTTIIFSGPQGCGKSLILKKLGQDWFNDSMENFKGDEAYIKMASSWIVELAELTAYNNSNLERLKAVLTSTIDTYRDKYGKNSKGHIRDCIFFGTTNEETFLIDETGNRRFIPMKVGVKKEYDLTIHDLTSEIVDQIWAEAKEAFLNGETNNLSEDEKVYLKELQKQFTAIDELEEEIAKYILKKIPSTWEIMSLEDKRNFVKEYDVRDEKDKFLMNRNKVCAREIREVLYRDEKIENKNLTSRINKRLKNLLGVYQTEKVNYKKYYGQQRGFFITETMLDKLNEKYSL